MSILRELETGVPGTLATGHPWLDARGNTSVAGVDAFLTVTRGKALRRSAGQSWANRNTPTVVHVDPLGRPFLEQRAKTSTAGDTTDVHVALDLQGRATAISARYVPVGETVRVTQPATTDVFDLLGRSLRHVRRDAQASGGTGGTTWVLPSVDGQPIRAWDSRDQALRRTFDALRRPRATFVQQGAGDDLCRLFTRYGESATTPKSARLLGQPWRVYDTAGLVTTLAVDVDHRVTSTSRRFVEAFRGLPDWTAHEDDPDTATDPTWLQDAAGTADEVYTQTATLDIAGRPLHDAVYRDVAAKHERRYGYDAGGQLVSVEVQSPGTSGWRPVVHDVTYNARGQRTQVLAGDDTGDASLETTYSYDADTFRLVRLAVTRLTDDEGLQDIRWVHDAVGNVTFQEDLGTDAVWFDNTTVQPHRKYAYDALDRLVEATGREHDSTFSGTGGGQRQTHRPYGLGPKAHAADGNALRSYTQRYTYDDVGNLRQLSHVVGTETTNRTYAYTEQVDGSLFNNRLLSTTVGSTTYPLTYDAHGNVTSMSHLPEMAWDAFDRLASVQTTARYPDVGADDEDEDELETPVDHDWFYVYDGAGQRVRKVRASGSSGVGRWEERLYVGPFEVWRKYDGSGDTSVERETLHVQDGDRRVAMVETLTWDGGAPETPVARWRYQLDDHLGTACGEVTETGLVIGWEEYHPYGTTAVWSFDATREVSGKRYRYTGMERDDETGLGYHSARYYCSWLGRWVACDPIGVKGGMNLFGYVTGNPVAVRDPTGQAGMSESIDDAIVGAQVNAPSAATRMGAAHGELMVDLNFLQEDLANLRAYLQSGDVQTFGQALDLLIGTTADGSFDPRLAAEAEVSRIEDTLGLLKESGLAIVDGHGVYRSNIKDLAIAIGIVKDVGSLQEFDISSRASGIYDSLIETISRQPLIDVITSGKGGVATAFARGTGATGAGIRILESGRSYGTYSELRAAKLIEGHHIVQNASVRDLPGYDTNAAPAVQLEGPSTTIGTEHYAATQVQRHAGGGTLASELRIAYKSLRVAGLSADEARTLVGAAEAYFRSIGASGSTVTRIPGTR